MLITYEYANNECYSVVCYREVSLQFRLFFKSCVCNRFLGSQRSEREGSMLMTYEYANNECYNSVVCYKEVSLDNKNVHQLLRINNKDF